MAQHVSRILSKIALVSLLALAVGCGSDGGDGDGGGLSDRDAGADTAHMPDGDQPDGDQPDGGEPDGGGQEGRPSGAVDEVRQGDPLEVVDDNLVQLESVSTDQRRYFEDWGIWTRSTAFESPITARAGRCVTT
ncbi:MAG: hypothetical protein ACLFVJ_16485 [Persicimonas sp.]